MCIRDRREAAAPVEAGTGVAAAKLAEQALVAAGFTITAHDQRVRGTGTTVPLVATDAAGNEWWFDIAGPNSTYRGGMARTDVVWRTLGRAAALRGARGTRPLVVLTTFLPRKPSEGETALRAAGSDLITDAVDLFDPAGLQRLARLAAGGAPEPGFWATAT